MRRGERRIRWVFELCARPGATVMSRNGVQLGNSQLSGEDRQVIPYKAVTETVKDIREGRGNGRPPDGIQEGLRERVLTLCPSRP